VARKKKMRVGLIADTHGLLRPEAKSFLQTADYIIHAGDIGAGAILDELRAISRVCAVRGNNDTGAWAEPLPESETLRLGAVGIYVIHDLGELRIDPAALGLQVVVSGHSHKPGLERRHGVLFLNPGSAGPRRFKLPIALGELLIEGTNASARLVELPEGRLLAAL
jgi:putative phosphoesterase